MSHLVREGARSYECDCNNVNAHQETHPMTTPARSAEARERYLLNKVLEVEKERDTARLSLQGMTEIEAARRVKIEHLQRDLNAARVRLGAAKQCLGVIASYGLSEPQFEHYHTWFEIDKLAAQPADSPVPSRDLDICARPKCKSPRHYNIHDPERGGHVFVEADSPVPAEPDLAETDVRKQLQLASRMLGKLTAEVAALDKAARLRWGAYDTSQQVVVTEPVSRRGLDLCVCRHRHGPGKCGNSCCACVAFVPHPQPKADTEAASVPVSVCEHVLDDASKRAEQASRCVKCGKSTADMGDGEMMAASVRTSRSPVAEPVPFTGTCAKCGELVSDGRAVHRECETEDCGQPLNSPIHKGPR